MQSQDVQRIRKIRTVHATRYRRTIGSPRIERFLYRNVVLPLPPRLPLIETLDLTNPAPLISVLPFFLDKSFHLWEK